MAKLSDAFPAQPPDKQTLMAAISPEQWTANMQQKMLNELLTKMSAPDYKSTTHPAIQQMDQDSASKLLRLLRITQQ